MSETSSLRSRKKQRTRRTIERVALDLFTERGFDGATVEEIAAAADISPRTFFHYFPSKEEVVLSDYAERLERILEVLRTSSPTGSPWQALRTAFLTVGADYEAEREDLLRRFRVIEASPGVAARNLQMQSMWETAVAELIGGWGDVGQSNDLRPQIMAGSALAAMRASLRRWLSEGGESRLPDHIEYCFDLLGRGFDEV